MFYIIDAQSQAYLPSNVTFLKYRCPRCFPFFSIRYSANSHLATLCSRKTHGTVPKLHMRAKLISLYDLQTSWKCLARNSRLYVRALVFFPIKIKNSAKKIHRTGGKRRGVQCIHSESRFGWEKLLQKIKVFFRWSKVELCSVLPSVRSGAGKWNIIWSISRNDLGTKLGPSFILPEIYPPTENTYSLREILKFQNTLRILGFEVEESESRGRISAFQHFIRRRTRLFAAKGYFFGRIRIAKRKELGQSWIAPFQ